MAIVKLLENSVLKIKSLTRFLFEQWVTNTDCILFISRGYAMCGYNIRIRGTQKGNKKLMKKFYSISVTCMRQKRGRIVALYIFYAKDFPRHLLNSVQCQQLQVWREVRILLLSRPLGSGKSTSDTPQKNNLLDIRLTIVHNNFHQQHIIKLYTELGKLLYESDILQLHIILSKK